MAQISLGRTVFIIAHRLSTVRPAHQIYVMEKGEIVEHGSHQELLSLKGFYARLHSHQDGYATATREGEGVFKA
jgi:subfamily B ATP-binding cassette protein HlyB/CyaB